MVCYYYYFSSSSLSLSLFSPLFSPAALTEDKKKEMLKKATIAASKKVLGGKGNTYLLGKTNEFVSNFASLFLLSSLPLY